MILFPAIDIKEGNCVRLLYGDMARATVYGSEPAFQAQQFAAAGCSWLHVVDLDGAVVGMAVNREAIKAILGVVDIPVQLGGGIRDRAGAEQWLQAGVSRIVLGTTAVRNPTLVRELAMAHPGKIAVALDTRGGQVATAGWVEDTKIPLLEAAKRFEGAGVAAILHTDIDRDGALTGANIAASAVLAEAVQIPVIVSGGVAGLSDLQQVRDARAAFAGVVVGRALYDGRVDLTEALSTLEGKHA